MEYIHREPERKFLKMNSVFKFLLLTVARQVGKTTMLKHLFRKDFFNGKRRFWNILATFPDYILISNSLFYGTVKIV